MAKKLLILLFLVVLAGVGFAAISSYRSAHRTADAVMNDFMADLAKMDADKTYRQFTGNLQAERSQADWRAYVRSLGPGENPVLAKQSAITDNFNVYPKGSNPQRFVYTLRIKNRDYQAVAVILKQDGSWKVDDFQGGYK